MMPWNRARVWTGESKQKFSEIKNVLSGNGVPYNFSTKTARDGAQPTRLVYVHKYEYEKAAHLISTILK
ncbi:MAG: hypothetical protein RSC25_06275 [Christensenella sp.]